jgi:hypothetical protein
MQYYGRFAFSIILLYFSLAYLYHFNIFIAQYNVACRLYQEMENSTQLSSPCLNQKLIQNFQIKKMRKIHDFFQLHVL